MHYVTKVQGGRSDGRVAALAGPSATTDSPKRVTRVIRDLVQGAWRRRLLIVLPILLMLPVSIAAAYILPKAYIARSLMQLQEAGRENPFSREGDQAGMIYRVQERFEGLRALFMSESVLARALGEKIDHLPPAEREARIGELRQALSLDLIGGDFIEVKLAGAKPEGLGRTLEAVMASFLEALVPEQGGATAAQLMVNARRQELDALTRSRDDAQRELATLLPNGTDDAARELATLEMNRRGKGDTLARVDTEITRLRELLGNPNDKQLEQDIAALPARSDQSVDERTRNLAALKSLLSLRQKLSAEAQNLGADANALNQRLTRFRDLQERLAGLDKEIASARESYESYQKRFSSSNAVRSVGILKAPELIRIVDPPRDPATASRSRVMYFLSGIMAGGLLGLGLAFAAERLDQRIRHADEASEATGLPVLAVVRDRDGGTEHMRSRSIGDGKPPGLSAAAS
ncbi:hypothetical protein [Microvirga pakistanensis]|uniref:hypothetical protein n=1 Tax=Microvirga pakistanensis TaxID=1682650 RepID=UPI00106D94BB|nr:hypothetical protein [Microvirga pakistanensis]